MFDFTKEDIEAAPKVPASNMNCTIVSLVPYPIRELKPNIIPGYFQIPRSRDGKPSVLPVGDSIHWIESPFPKNPPMKVTESSRAIAKAIVNDYIDAQLALDSDAGPGLFWVEGHFDSDGVVKNFPKQLLEAKDRQNRWFVSLVRLADDDWAQHHMHKGISDIQRYAATSLGYDKEWLTTTLDTMTAPCPMCRTQVSTQAVICASCGYVINLDAYEKMKDRIVTQKGGNSGISPNVSASVPTQKP